MSKVCMLCQKELSLKSQLMIDTDLCRECYEMIEDAEKDVIRFPAIMRGNNP